jgi:hypothetical protein
LSSTVDAATPTQAKATLSGSSAGAGTINPLFNLTGYAYVKAAGAFPRYDGVRHVALPRSPTVFGNVLADFVTDAPAVSFQQVRADLGSLRVLVDNGDGKGLTEQLRCGSSLQAGTAQAGASGTITLATGASATNNQYAGCWVKIQ